MRQIRRILFLADPEYDHLSYMMFEGLYDIIQKDDLFVYPHIQYFKGGRDYWSKGENKDKYTDPLKYCKAIDYTHNTIEQLCNNIGSFDIIFLSNCREYAIRALDQLVGKLGIESLPPIVCCDGEDSTKLDHIEWIKRKYGSKLIVSFKRDFLISDYNRLCSGDRGYIDRFGVIYPISFSSPKKSIEWIDRNENDKDIDICVQFGDTNPIREDIIKKLLEKELHNKYNCHLSINGFLYDRERLKIDNRVQNIIYYAGWEEYMSWMSRSKINIIARGHGIDTVRRFEAMCFSGLVLSDILPIVTPDPFTGGEHLIYYSDMDNMIGMIEYYLSHKEERVRIGNAGKDWNNRFHSTRATAAYLLERIKGHI